MLALRVVIAGVLVILSGSFASQTEPLQFTKDPQSPMLRARLRADVPDQVDVLTTTISTFFLHWFVGTVDDGRRIRRLDGVDHRHGRLQWQVLQARNLPSTPRSQFHVTRLEETGATQCSGPLPDATWACGRDHCFWYEAVIITNGRKGL